MTQSLKDLLAAIAVEKQDWRWLLLNNWQQIMGPLHEQVRLEKVEEATLILGVYQSSWLQELYLLTPMLIKTINEHLGHDHIQNIKFRASVKKAVMQKNVRPRTYRPIMPRELTRYETTALAKVEDEQLRSLLQTFLWRCTPRTKKFGA